MIRTIKTEKAKPNWREPKAYEFTKTLNKEQWAWEFLRRNPEYIKEFKERTPGEIERRKQLLSDPETKDIKCFDGIRYINPDDPHFSIHLDNTYFLNKWGMLYMVNPDEGYPFPNPFNQRRTMQNGTLKGGTIVFGDFRYLDIRGDYIPVVFDMARPIKSQINNAQKRLLEWQKDLKHDRKETRETSDWTDFLRILDAKAENIKNDEIAEVVFSYLTNEYPNYSRNDRFRKALKRAKHLSSKGYKEIAMKY